MRVFALENNYSSQNPRNTRPHSPTNYARNYPRPSSPTQSHSHSQAQSREVLSDSSTPIAENWCVTKVRKRPSFKLSYSIFRSMSRSFRTNGRSTTFHFAKKNSAKSSNRRRSLVTRQEIKSGVSELTQRYASTGSHF